MKEQMNAASRKKEKENKSRAYRDIYLRFASLYLEWCDLWFINAIADRFP